MTGNQDKCFSEKRLLISFVSFGTVGGGFASSLSSSFQCSLAFQARLSSTVGGGLILPRFGGAFSNYLSSSNSGQVQEKARRVPQVLGCFLPRLAELLLLVVLQKLSGQLDGRAAPLVVGLRLPLRTGER